MMWTERQLMAWGSRVGAEVSPPVFLGLDGPLGAGKSVFARALARGAGVTGPIPSPTFNLVFTYPLARGRSLIHADLFRLESEGELAQIGWDDIVSDPVAIVVVEWSVRAGRELPRERWEIAIDFVPGRPELRSVRTREVGCPPALPAPGWREN